MEDMSQKWTDQACHFRENKWQHLLPMVKFKLPSDYYILQQTFKKLSFVKFCDWYPQLPEVILSLFFNYISLWNQVFFTYFSPNNISYSYSTEEIGKKVK